MKADRLSPSRSEAPGRRLIAVLATLAALTAGAVLAFNPQPDPPMPVDKIASLVHNVRGQHYILLADVAAALGSQGFEHHEARNLYELVPGRGVLLYNPAGVSRLGRVPASRRGQAPPAEGIFAIHGQVVSKGVIPVNGKPMIPLNDLAAAMGREVGMADGKLSLLVPAVQKVQKVAPAPTLLGISPSTR